MANPYTIKLSMIVKYSQLKIWLPTLAVLLRAYLCLSKDNQPKKSIESTIVHVSVLN